MKSLYDWKNKINNKELEEVVKTLNNDELVLIPTETVYGIGANAYSDIACKKIYEAKNRNCDNPLIIHVSDCAMLEEIAYVKNEVEKKLIKAFMPGPFTIILDRKSDKLANTALAGLDTLGVRMPSNVIMHTIIKELNKPIAAPSANISGRPSGTNVDDIYDELNQRVEVMIDGGQCDIGIESTVVRVIDDCVVILRPGYITEEDIKKVVPNVKLSDKLFKKVEKDEKVLSPGMKYRHYAPSTKCVLVKYGDEQISKINKLILENNRVAVLGFKEDKDNINIDEKYFINLGSKENLKEISSNTFTSLRKVDKLNVDLAIIEAPEKKGLGLSILNRLVRAAENNII